MGIKRVGQNPFKSALGVSDSKQRNYSERAANPNLFKGDVREKHMERTMRSRQAFKERISALRQQHMGG